LDRGAQNVSELIAVGNRRCRNRVEKSQDLFPLPRRKKENGERVLCARLLKNTKDNEPEWKRTDLYKTDETTVRNRGPPERRKATRGRSSIKKEKKKLSLQTVRNRGCKNNKNVFNSLIRGRAYAKRDSQKP